MLYGYISRFRLVNFDEIPFFGILFKVNTIGASVVLVKEGSHGVDAWFEFLTGKGHVNASYPRSIACKHEIHVGRFRLFGNLQRI
jgi:hypothetical protein